jgi:hypothetical protein
MHSNLLQKIPSLQACVPREAEIEKKLKRKKNSCKNDILTKSYKRHPCV